MKIPLIHSLWRFLIHIPIGITAYKLCKKNGILGLVFILLFIAYEESEDNYLSDKAYKDYQGAMGGLSLMLFLDRRK